MSQVELSREDQEASFADRMAIGLRRALVRQANGRTQEATQIMSDLCGEAERFAEQAKMQKESASADRYGLAGLAKLVNLNNTDSELVEE